MQSNKISFSTAVLLNMNIMIGAGLLIGPQMMVATSGNASFIGWILAALAFIPIVFSFTKLSSLVAPGGSMYDFVKAGTNHTCGFFSAWMYCLGYLFCSAVELMALHSIFISMVGKEHFLSVHSYTFYLGIMAFITAINLASVNLIGALQNSITLIKLVPIVVLVALFGFQIDYNFSISAIELSQVATALPWAIFGFLGFEACCNIAHLIQGGEHKARAAIITGFLTTAFLYAAFHFGLLHVMGAAALEQEGASAFARYLHLPSFVVSALNLLVSLLAFLTFIGGIISITLSNTSYVHQLLKKGVLIPFHFLVSVNKRERPWVLVVLHGILVAGLCMIVASTKALGYLANVAIFCTYGVAMLSLIGCKDRYSSSPFILLGACLGFCSVAGILAYSFVTSGSGCIDRMLMLFPLFVFTLLGYSLQNRKY